MVRKILINKSGKVFYIKDPEKDFHSQYGIFETRLLKKKPGSEIRSNRGEAFTVIDPSFIDLYKKIKRDAQIISLKDIGAIISNSGINKDTFVVDAGSGSGALCCFLAKIARKVVSYEIRKDFQEIVKENKKALGLKNLTIKNKDVYKGIEEKNVDVIILDLPEPWKAIESAFAALRPGGFLISYSPSIPQSIDFVNYILQSKGFCHIKTIELLQREWEIFERRVRPKTQMIGHTGFISFSRRI